MLIGLRSCHRFIVTALAAVLLGALPCAAHAQLPDVEIPEVQVPDVQVPEVQIPDVQVPGVDLPDVEAPDVQVPEVQVPDLPAVDEPAVTVPDLRTPDVGGEAPAPSSGDGTTTRSSGGGGGGAGATSGSGRTGGATTASTTGTASGPRDGDAPRSGSRDRSSARREGSAGRDRTRERRLRRVVRAADACLAVLTTDQRRVLVLRAGLGSRDPHTRRATAERLDLSLRRVRRSERAGLARLRALDGPCGTTTAGGGTTVGGDARGEATASGTVALVAAHASPISASSRDDDGQSARSSVLGERDTQAGPEAVTPATLFPGGPAPTDGDLSVYFLGLLALTVIVLLHAPALARLGPAAGLSGIRDTGRRKAGAAGMGGKRRPLGDVGEPREGPTMDLIAARL